MSYIKGNKFEFITYKEGTMMFYKTFTLLWKIAEIETTLNFKKNMLKKAK